MFKRVLDSKTTRNVALEAIMDIARPVKQTLGPGGNPIIIERQGTNPDGSFLGPLITKDGVTVAENVSFRDPAKNTISRAILQVAQKTVADGGDGTTTSVVLAEAIYKAGHKHVEQGSNGIELFNSLNAVKEEVLEFIERATSSIQGEDVINVAKISANGDEHIAKIVYDALNSAGEEGYVSLEEGYSHDTVLEKVNGAVYKRGWRNFAPNGSLLVNDKSRNVCEIVNPAVLIYADKLDDLIKFQDFLGMVWKYNSHTNIFDEPIPLMLIAHDFSDDIKNKILQIRIQGKLPIAAIKSPADGSPNARTEMLEDIAAMLGATVASRGILELSDVKDEHLGNCERIEIGPEETVFYGGSGDSKVIMNRIEELNTLLKTAQLHPYDADNIRLRKGKLSGGISIVKVGGVSELEMRERKDRIEDALCAARVAIQEGIIPGGGWTFYRIAQILESRTETSVAQQIMIEALKAPIRQIILNAGQNPDVILTKMPEDKGYDARKKEYVDLIDAGIIDPSKVARSALENAVSIAGLLLTTGGALVSDLESNDGKANPLAGMFGA